MPIHDAHHVVGYVDASFTKAAAGAGYVVRIGDRVHLGGYPLAGMTDANQAEARAARDLVARIMACPVTPARIDLMSDSQDLICRSRHAGPVRARRPSAHMDAVHDDILDMQALCRDGGTRLALDHCRGHAATGSAAGFLNHCADRLSVLGASGQALSWDVPYDPFWRMRIAECHEAFRYEGLGLIRAEAADYLGLSPDVVDRLVAHRHLRPVPGLPLLDARSLMQVRRQVLERGHAIPPRREPLRPMRGRIDEGESGFGPGARAACPVQAVVHIADAGEDAAAVISLEGRAGVELHAALLPAAGAPSWEPVLEGLLDLVRDRYPACDRLAVLSPDEDLVEVLNGRGSWDGCPVLDTLDERIAADGFTILASPLPRHWKGWRVRLPATLLPDLLETGAGGSWTVLPNLDGTGDTAPAGREPPWATGRAAPPGPRP